MSHQNPSFLYKKALASVAPSQPALPELSLEAGESLVAGTPVCAIANKLYAADPVTNFRVIGLLASDVTLGFLGTVITSGDISLSGLTSGLDYFLVSSGISSTAPSSGKVLKVGTAVTASILVVNIQLSVLLS